MQGVLRLALVVGLSAGCGTTPASIDEDAANGARPGSAVESDVTLGIDDAPDVSGTRDAGLADTIDASAEVDAGPADVLSREDTGDVPPQDTASEDTPNEDTASEPDVARDVAADVVPEVASDVEPDPDGDTGADADTGVSTDVGPIETPIDHEPTPVAPEWCIGSACFPVTCDTPTWTLDAAERFDDGEGWLPGAEEYDLHRLRTPAGVHVLAIRESSWGDDTAFLLLRTDEATWARERINISRFHAVLDLDGDGFDELIAYDRTTGQWFQGELDEAGALELFPILAFPRDSLEHFPLDASRPHVFADRQRSDLLFCTWDAEDGVVCGEDLTLSGTRGTTFAPHPTREDERALVVVHRVDRRDVVSALGWHEGGIEVLVDAVPIDSAATAGLSVGEYAVAAADFDGNGETDVRISGRFVPGALAVVDLFGDPEVLPVTADVGTDVLPDSSRTWVVPGPRGPLLAQAHNASVDTLSFRQLTRAGDSVRESILAVYPGTASLALADVSGDGAEDIVATTVGGLRIIDPTELGRSPGEIYPRWTVGGSSVPVGTPRALAVHGWDGVPAGALIRHADALHLRASLTFDDSERGFRDGIHTQLFERVGADDGGCATIPSGPARGFYCAGSGLHITRSNELGLLETSVALPAAQLDVPYNVRGPYYAEVEGLPALAFQGDASELREGFPAAISDDARGHHALYLHMGEDGALSHFAAYPTGAESTRFSGDIEGDGTSEFTWWDADVAALRSWSPRTGELVHTQVGYELEELVDTGFLDTDGDGVTELWWVFPDRLERRAFSSEGGDTFPAGTWSSPVELDGGTLRVADAEQDGRFELYLNTTSSGVDELWRVDLESETWQRVGAELPYASLLRVGDFSGDGVADLLYSISVAGLFVVRGTCAE